MRVLLTFVSMGFFAAAGCGRPDGVIPVATTGAGAGAGGAADTGEGAGGDGGAPYTGVPAVTAPCEVNCCSGLLVSEGDEMTEAQCEAAGKDGAPCGEDGGPAKVFFDGKGVWQDLTCDGNCAVNCCDGTVIFSTENSQDACELEVGTACGDGGPWTVAFDHVLAWTAGDDCPSLRGCTLTCADGAETSSSQYQAKVCVAAATAGTFCEAHGGNAAVHFDGQQVWP